MIERENVLALVAAVGAVLLLLSLFLL